MRHNISNKIMMILVFSSFLIISVNNVESQSLPPQGITALAWSPDSSHIAYGDSMGVIRIMKVDTGNIVQTLSGHTERILGLAWSADGMKLASTSGDTSIRVWSIDGTLIHTLTGYTTFSLGVIWSLDSNYIIGGTINDPYNLRIWNANTGSMITNIPEGSLTTFTLNPSGDILAAGSAEGSIVFYNPISLAYANIPKLTHPEGISYGEWGTYVLDWHPDSLYLAGGSVNGRVRIWNTTTGEIEHDLLGTDTADYDFWKTRITDLTFSPNGSLVESINIEGFVRIWDTNSGQLLASQQLPDASIYAADFSPDGTKLVYGSENGNIEIVSLPDPMACQATQTVAAGDVAGFINAINAANANTDASVIGVDGTYTFTAINNGLNALPKITTDITICSQNGATLTRQAGSPAFRFFEVASTGTLTLENLTLTGAEANTDPGGAILNHGTLILNNVTFTENAME